MLPVPVLNDAILFKFFKIKFTNIYELLKQKPFNCFIIE